MPLIIRPVHAADYDQWHDLWLGYNTFYGRHGVTALPEIITQTTWSRFFDESEPMQALVAEVDTPQGPQLVGLVHYLYHRTTLALQPTCYLHDLFTAESVRGQGIGRQLIEAVYDAARAAGASRVYWLTHETNTTARHLYDQVAENSGYIVYRHPLG